jgi:hypothetical protein
MGKRVPEAWLHVVLMLAPRASRAVALNSKGMPAAPSGALSVTLSGTVRVGGFLARTCSGRDDRTGRRES